VALTKVGDSVDLPERDMWVSKESSCLRYGALVPGKKYAKITRFEFVWALRQSQAFYHIHLYEVVSF